VKRKFPSEIRLIVWHDAVSPIGSGWKDLRPDRYDNNVVHCVSVGLVVRDDPQQVSLVSHFFDEEDGKDFLRSADGAVSIPRGCIVRQFRVGSYRPGPKVRRCRS
jgi:hypothetical protein